MEAHVVHFESSIALLEHLVIESRLPYIILIVCSTRSAFLEQIIPSILEPPQQHEIPPSQETAAADDHQANVGSSPHPFLVPTLQLLASSKTVKLAFCPTIDTLRAYLSGYVPPSHAGAGLDHPHLDSSLRSLMAILDLVFLHRATSEFSIQGLARTFAAAIAAASRLNMNLLLCECSDIHDLENPERGSRLWDAQVPLLSGSVRIGAEGSTWARRSINVKAVAERWFKFKEKEEGGRDIEDEEMLV